MVGDPFIELKNLLSACNQLYRALQSIVGDQPSTDAKDLTEDDAQQALKLTETLLEMISVVNARLAAHVLSGAPHSSSLSESELKFFNDEVRANEGNVAKLMPGLYRRLGIDIYSLLGLSPRPEVEVPGVDLRKKSWGIRNTFLVAMDYRTLEAEHDSTISHEEITAAQSIIDAPFFDPDEWYRNAQEVLPLHGNKADQRIPWIARERLKELYHSFILGNYLSSIAMARTILEFAIVHLAGQLGIDPNTTDLRGRPVTKRLRQLVEQVSSIRPELEPQMNLIVDFGNRIIHPKRSDTALLFKEQGHPVALRVLEATREVVLTLYLSPKSGQGSGSS